MALSIDTGARDGRSTLLIRSDQLPAEGSLQAGGTDLAIDVVQDGLSPNLALLLGPPLPATIGSTLLAGSRGVSSGTPLTPIGIDGRAQQPASVAVVRMHPSLGQIELERALPAGTLLHTGEGPAVGWVVERGARAVTFDAVTGWTNRRFGQPLAQAQAAKRANDPRSILQAARSVLEDRSADETRIRNAVRDCTRVSSGGLAAPREAIEQAQELQRALWLNLVRSLANAGQTAKAVSTAREALAAIPDHHALASDMIQMLALPGPAAAPAEALGRFEQLAALSPGDAQSATESLARGLIRFAEGEVRARRAAAAAQLLERAVRAMPGHQTLAAAAKKTRRAATESARPALPGEIVIPFDPSTNAINASVSVAGASVRFIVDTGATMTTIPVATASQLRLLSDSNQVVTVNTASGQARGQLVEVPWLQIGGARIANRDGSGIRAIAIDLPGSLKSRGLLGMNVLQKFDLNIDNANGRMVLKRR